MKIFDVPPNLLIEATNHCNLRCPVCPTTNAMTRPRGYMSYDAFRDLILNLVNHNKRPRLRFMFAGEPMMHKKISNFINLAHKYRFTTDICTNGMFYRVFDHPPTTMTICIDGANAVEHESYRIGSDFKRICDNAVNLIEDNPGTKFTMQSLVTKYSQHSRERILDLAEDLGFSYVRLKNIHLGHGFTPNAENIQPDDQDYCRSFRPRRLCRTPSNHNIIFWNGSLGVCCIDYDNITKSPPIALSRYVETITSLRWKYYRLKGMTKSYQICDECELSGALGMSDEVYL